MPRDLALRKHRLQACARADALDHVASVGGYLDEVGAARVTLTEAQRRSWSAAAALLREHAHGMNCINKEIEPKCDLICA